MNKRSLSILGACLLPFAFALAAPRATPKATPRATPAAPIQESLIAEAIRPMQDGVPAVSVVRFRQLLTAPRTAETTRTIRLNLCEALSKSGDAKGILEATSSWKTGETPEFAFWKAEAEAYLGNWSNALDSYRLAQKSVDRSYSTRARFGEAEMLVALARPGDAIPLLEKVTQQPDAPAGAFLRLAELSLREGRTDVAAANLTRAEPSSQSRRSEELYLEASCQMALGKYQNALDTFARVQRDGNSIPQQLTGAIAVARATCFSALRNPDAARETLETLIESHPETPILEQAFLQLDDLIAAEKNPSLGGLREWTKREPKGRAAFAEFLRGRMSAREGNFERAQSSYERAARRFGQQAAAPYALVELSALQERNGDFEGALVSTAEALRLLPERHPLRSRALFSSALALYALHRAPEAAAVFQKCAETGNPTEREIARFNASVCWLGQGNYPNFLQHYKEFSALHPESELRRELLFQEGCRQAREEDPRAFQTLSVFARDFPGHRRVPAAYLALAETALLAKPSDTRTASYYLKAATDAEKPTDRSDCLALFLADSTGEKSTEELIRLAETFLREHPASTLALDVRLKLAELLFRAENYAAAATQFEAVSKEMPEGLQAENALYLAAESAIRSVNPESADHAIELLDQVAEKNGPLKLRARLKQAQVKLGSGKNSEALVLFDDILASQPDPEMRFSAQLGKAETLISTTPNGVKNEVQGMELLDQVAADPATPDRWKNEAIWRKGKTLEQRGDAAAALAAYYQVLDRPPASPDADFFWFYKAAFETARILENRGDWASAINVYRQIAERQGPRASEAKERMTHLRLDHFLWGD